MNMQIKVIKNDQDYKQALQLVDELMDRNPKHGSADGEKLELLAALIEKYESEIYPETLPDPIDAIIFTMEQRNLTPLDLIPFIGSRSKVSEVLSRKRPLTLNMIKALQEGLEIPAKVLLNQERATVEVNKEVYEKFPIKEMIKRGYLSLKSNEDINSLKEEINNFFSAMSPSQEVFALLSKTYYIRSPRPMNSYYLFTWATRIAQKAKEVKDVETFSKQNVNFQLMKTVIDLSDEDNGVKRAIELLKSHGIIVVIEPHFPYTYLDGAAIIINDFNPIIGLTLRKDTLDNFWFTLMHELAHIILHSDSGIKLFYDDLYSVDQNDSRELEADKLATEAMVPDDKWKRSPASILPSMEAAKRLANDLSVHPAIIAGKMRYQNNYFSYLNSLVGQGEVRVLFPEVNWSI